ncbi:hypothetical protein Hanom_Chr13g01226731 [Helianthus anomalus]
MTCRSLPTNRKRSRQSPRSNPHLFNPPPPREYDLDGVIDDEANFMYDLTMAQLQFVRLRLGGSQTNFNTTSHVTNPPHANPPPRSPLPTNPCSTQVIPNWVVGYKTNPGDEYLSPPHDEQSPPTPD